MRRQRLAAITVLAPAIHYSAGSSTGVTVQVAAVRTVVVTNELVEKTILVPGESLSYHATVWDNTGAAIPSAFQARLMMDTTQLVAFSFAPDVYNPTTGALALAFTVPEVPAGTYTIRLEWDAQTIT